MNFLALCQRLRQEARIAGTGPSATTGQTGQSARLVSWINNAWMDVQQIHNEWLWMVGSFSGATVADDNTYTAADWSVTDLRDWKRDTFTCYLASLGVSDESELGYVPYPLWRREYAIGTQTASRPLHVTVKPDLSVGLGPKPDAIYTVQGEYQKSASELSGDSDTPELPSEFHMLIVWWALAKYAVSEAAPEVYAFAEAERRRLLRELERTQLPDLLMAGPLL